MTLWEFDDMKRPHVGYQDPVYKEPYWMAAGSNGPYNNMLRGFWSAALGTYICEPLAHVKEYVGKMCQVYDWPATRQEANIFAKEVVKIKGFWKELFKRFTFGSAIALGDLAPRFAFFHFIYGGTTAYTQVADWNIAKHFICAQMSAIATCWLAGPFDVAWRAYKADKSWPKELQKGYRSPLHALLTIPFREGPYFLFQGTLPLALYSYSLQSWFFMLFTFFKNKFFWLWVYHEFNYNYIKSLMIGASFGTAVLCSYPFYFAKTMIDEWPLEKGGHCTFNRSYAKAMMWQFNNLESVFTNFFQNFWREMPRHGFPFLIAAWYADNLGLLNPSCHELWGNENYWATMIDDL